MIGSSSLRTCQNLICEDKVKYLEGVLWNIGAFDVAKSYYLDIQYQVLVDKSGVKISLSLNVFHVDESICNHTTSTAGP